MVAHHARDVSLSAMESGGGYNRNKITEESTGREVKSQLRGYKTSDDEKGDSRRRVKWLDQKSPLVKVFRLIHHEMTLWDRAGPTQKCVNGTELGCQKGVMKSLCQKMGGGLSSTQTTATKLDRTGPSGACI